MQAKLGRYHVSGGDGFFAENIFIGIMMPAFERIHQISYQLPTDIDATLTVIALLRYKQERGSCPENLDELMTAGYIKKIPMDAFSDRPLVYKKMGDDFILYSVGHNYIDDGGKMGTNKEGKPHNWADNGDMVFWPVEK